MVKKSDMKHGQKASALPEKAEDLSGIHFPVIGIGASAGGLAAFEAFFSGMPLIDDPGMAFVLVQHLDPDHKSILTDLIRRYTRMQVYEVEDGMKVRPNCAYIIPPAHDMAFLDGSLHLMEPSAPRGRRLPIDFFFRSLAQDQRERAVCIVLSGTGSDGSLGVRAVKGEGGMVMVQSPDSAEYDGMPCSALATGMVDYELPPSEMPEKLISYVARAFSKPISDVPPHPKEENSLKKIIILLRIQTGHDFSQYKPNTINRRIARRMAVHKIENQEDYVLFLQHTPAEGQALFRDLLIGVTSFFRDHEAFRELEEKIIPKLFDSSPEGTAVRVWSPGCSTGEEAYSLAILLQERLEILRKHYTVQIFATDIDSQAIAAARAGRYPAGIAADISEVRLQRFFSAEPGGSGYRVNKSIRDLLVFSEQDLVKDPPFSKLDLICCRNLLIYMSGELQMRLIPLFHFGLNPGRFLFLGSSESVGEFSDLFEVLDRKAKIYLRKDESYSVYHTRQRSLPSLVKAAVGARRQTNPGSTSPVKLPFRELTEKAILQQISSAGVLVNRQGTIFYLHGRTGLYLEPAPGEAKISNILKMAREGLRGDLTTALHKAASQKELVRYPGLKVKTNGDFSTVNLTVSPVDTGAAELNKEPLYLVLLEEAPPAVPAQESRIVKEADTDLHIEVLRNELRAKEEYLQSVNEELETSNEELKSSNEEMQSINEEMQSTNEELETSKEELQSVNEELATVNTELQNKVSDLSQANNDMNNLLAGTGIATVFVDHNLHILRFTPTATKIINLITSDIGRPVGHLASNLVGYNRLPEDVQAVLNTLVPVNVELQTANGKWYTMRIQPYRTLDNVIEGAVITFVEITEIYETREALRSAQASCQLAISARDSKDAVIVQNMDGRILSWNDAAEQMYGWTQAEALEMNIKEIVPQELREDVLIQLGRLSRADILEPCRTQRLTKNGSVLDVRIAVSALMNDAGRQYASATIERPDRIKAVSGKAGSHA